MKEKTSHSVFKQRHTTIYIPEGETKDKIKEIFENSDLSLSKVIWSLVEDGLKYRENPPPKIEQVVMTNEEIEKFKQDILKDLKEMK